MSLVLGEDGTSSVDAARIREWAFDRDDREVCLVPGHSSADSSDPVAVAAAVDRLASRLGSPVVDGTQNDGTRNIDETRR